MNFSAALPTFIITLREGVEAALVVGIVLAMLAKAKQSRLNPWVYAGVGVGIVGVVLQTTTRNDLADPSFFGPSSGAAAAAGAVFVITVTGDILGFWTLPFAAFTGGNIASAIVLRLVHSLRTSAPEKLVLAGLAVSFLFAAITSYLIFAGDSRAAHSVIF